MMIKHILKYGLFTACLSLMLVNLSSCQDDDSSGGGAPEILSVRLTDPEKADSTFTQANAGQWIAVMGKNLQGVKKAYINDQSISFNPLYNTATNIILSIPTEINTKTGKEFELLYTTEDGGVLAIRPGTIRLETDRGVASYAFTVLGGDPSITMVDAEEYPVPTGGKVMVTGNNFVNIQRIYFTNISPDSVSQEGAQKIEVTTGFDVQSTRYLDQVKGYVVESILTFVLPDLPRDEGGNYFGYLVIDGQGPSASQKFSTLPAPIIESVSSDMPMPGTRVTLNGLYFIGIEQININGDEILILPEDMEITRTSLSFIMPDKPTNPKSNPLRIVGEAGEVTLDQFYPYENVLFDLDTKGRDKNWGPTPDYQEADGVNPPYVSDGNFAQIKGTTVDWWGPLVYWELGAAAESENVSVTLPSYEVIPADTPIEEVYFAYECYNRIPFNLSTTGGAHIRYAFNSGMDAGFDGAGMIKYQDYSYMEGPTNVVLPGSDGEPRLDEWYMVMIPLSRFEQLDGFGTTYKDFAEAGIVEFFMQLQHSNGPQGEVDVCFDNFRIVTKLTSIKE